MKEQCNYKEKVIKHHEKYIKELLKTEPRKVEIVNEFRRKGFGLDIGCGTGQYLHKNLIGVDISPKCIEIAKADSKTAYLMDAEDLTFDSRTFDYVVCLSTMYYIENQKKVFDEAWRVLKNGGIFVFDTLDKFHPKTLYWKYRYKDCPQFFATRSGLIKELEKKWRNIEVHQDGTRITVRLTK